MGRASSSIDYGGARGSNAGDEFHELWALQRTLDLLQPDTALTAVSVEGVRTETSSCDPDAPTWSGVDCALYYGGATLESVDRIEFIQLKYSAANPDTPWSIARLTNSSAKRKNNSVVRKMANDFADARACMKEGALLRIRLVSNQEISKGLRNALHAVWTGLLENASIDCATVKDLKRLMDTSGLSERAFRDFLKVLDFNECGYHSRFSACSNAVSTVADLLGDDVLPEVRELRLEVRKLMMPETASEIVTEKEVLLWFGLSGREGLLPCPPEISTPKHVVRRSVADDIVELLARDERLVLVHGVGGCGKTTLLHQITDRLPEGSATVLFDCFGGGRYIHPEDKRHLPENAFLHLANELAVVLQLPLFIPRSTKYPANIRSFLQKLRLAGEALQKRNPDGKLVVIVDAADNAVAAAISAAPPEQPFVFDLFRADLSALPKNVHIIASCRTGRRRTLHLPGLAPAVTCLPFNMDETREHLGAVFPNLDECLVEKFHVLSDKNPRVQAYAIAASGGDRNRLLEGLLPTGKTLPDVLRERFDNALKKLGQPTVFERLVEALSFLPSPIAVPTIARIVDCEEDVVRNFARDLSPGLRYHKDTITVADEDFEAFIKGESSANRIAILEDIAEEFLATFEDDPYSSAHVADALIGAGRARDILSVIERDPRVCGIGDPIQRRRVQVRRLKLGLAACRETCSTVDTLKTILISAEAEGDDRRLTTVLEKELDLSVQFAGGSLRRTMLLDRDRIKDRGSFLAQDALRAIQSGDRATAREQLYFYDAWLKRRNGMADKDREDWAVEDRDIAARVETILELDGPGEAFHDLMRWKPRNVALRVACILVPQLIAAGKAHHITALLEECSLPKPWDLLLWVPLAMAGEPVDCLAIERSLSRIRSRFLPNGETLGISYGEDRWQTILLDTFVTACELGYTLKLDSQAILGALDRILNALEGNGNRRLFDSDVFRIDGLLRCWLLKEAISETKAKAADFIAYVKTFDPVSKSKTRRRSKKLGARSTVDQANNSQDERRDKVIRALFPVYSARLEILSCTAQEREITDGQLDRLSSIDPSAYDFDYSHYSIYLRDVAAQSVMGLLIVENIEASELVESASVLCNGRVSDLFAGHRKKLWARMRLRPSESHKLIKLVSEAASSVKGLHVASSEKLEALVSLSRLTLPVSRSDAEALFNDAVDIAAEIDQEAFDQIDFVSVLSDRGSLGEDLDQRTIATSILGFVSGAAERLSDRDGFPWRAAVHALTCLDDSVALSAICKWADDGTNGLDDTLGQFLLTALQRDIIAPGVATSLALLIEGSDNALQMELVSQATKGPQRNEAVIEELCKDVLLLSPQRGKLQLGQEIVDRISKNGSQDGPWLKDLRDTIAFLRRTTNAKPGKEETGRRDRPPRLTSSRDLPKEFDFDPEGRVFVSAESIVEVLEAAEKSDLRHNVRDLLRKMRDESSTPRDRVPFLNALTKISRDSIIGSTTRVEMICETLAAWKGTPAVDRWCKESLPSVLIEHFDEATCWLKEGQATLQQLLDFVGANGDDRLQILLAGVEQVGEALNSHTLFAIAEEIARALDERESSTLLRWYAERLRSRLPADDPTSSSPAELPDNQIDAIARFLFALMSDIDKRIRWKAAHALRRLANLSCFDVVKATASQLSRVRDNAFRDPSAPFYYLAAKLWMAIALHRISAEAPAALSSCKAEILDLATSSKLPHVGIREYAKRALLHLVSAGAISLTASEKSQVDRVNIALRGRSAKKEEMPRSFGHVRDDKRRFNFDIMDTLPYWYADLLRFFPSASPDEILDIAERWIVDEWGADSETGVWAEEPRKARYGERYYGSWSHSHGSLPTIERYGTYLEWNAMYCVVGELLTTHPISKGDNYGSYDHWLREVLPTEAPAWLSDNRSPTPLEPRLWSQDPRTDSGWVHNMRRSEFVTEVGIRSPLRKGWIAVAGYHTSHFQKREASTRISSALVSPKTAPALVRALQTASDPWDFRIPAENDGLQIDASPYCLTGWIVDIEGDICFDEHDPFRYEVGKLQAKPGRKLAEALGLVTKADNPRTWVCRDTGEAAFKYEAWCDEPLPEEERVLREIRSDGWRLWARSDMVLPFLASEGWDVICEVQVERRLRNERGQFYGEDVKRRIHDKILLLRADGSVSDSKRCIGTWAGSRRGTRA